MGARQVTSPEAANTYPAAFWYSRTALKSPLGSSSVRLYNGEPHATPAALVTSSALHLSAPGLGTPYGLISHTFSSLPLSLSLSSDSLFL
ncbi:hypothetical protein E2C01_060518 [Portunus trituberculatus]|uniref:Uncharacterized protein n=1 Tax=Portunus trituberculatus TaxID=210409 RepID=A0A5B7H1D8_PORTR|nr:hypothetical protein [Portunus trituberculatus]